MTDSPLWTREIESIDAETTQALAARIAGALGPGDLILLSGELGAGKTTFTQGLGEGLGVRGGIISPTFVLARVHPALADGPDLVHVDAYRLGSSGEIDDIDLEATMPTSVTVIEWGRGKAEHLADSYLEIHLLRATGDDEAGEEIIIDFEETDEDDPRVLRISGYGPRWADPALLGL
ncbi:tRNA (adenosine(37)-N6)-threonylcarbamoyltransferase complex ATPase subunit type 1 TsaE [Zhihengliuella salsuginis]|uniref:tRNA (adenosine(37)-N6)-threonylcarbamoyltransferase complex ATPase subunit type 1 TsaE n=1 Tax=Zhihengliuella salsuginis TaxID=578222 RepID=UPI001676655D|nr:tRNA (adenosine(37)-N6)-threonylcarbamoyltransferase complex ATPase subunit type 1 TsaE [Zhihengliuella salsuginis]